MLRGRNNVHAVNIIEFTCKNGGPNLIGPPDCYFMQQALVGLAPQEGWNIEHILIAITGDRALRGVNTAQFGLCLG